MRVKATAILITITIITKATPITTSITSMIATTIMVNAIMNILSTTMKIEIDNMYRSAPLAEATSLEAIEGLVLIWSVEGALGLMRDMLCEKCDGKEWGTFRLEE
jgi:hypothetical protein